MKVKIKNRKASFNYEFLETEIAGIVLSGTEIKSVSLGQAAFTDSYCFFKDGELWIKNLHISEYKNASFTNHEPKRDRKLLLTKYQLRRFEEKLNEKGLTIVPTLLFTNDKGLIKIEIALAKGKKIKDKKQTILERDIKRDMDREIKNYKR
jgi:SsrA-binding protein